MRSKLFALLVLVPAVAAASLRSQSAPAPFDAAVVAWDERTCQRTMLDLNGDGRDDFVGFWDTQGFGFFLRGYVHDGAGSFQQAFSITPSVTTVQSRNWDMARGRFNADGLDDFAVLAGFELRVYTSNGLANPRLIWRTQSLFGMTLAVLDFDDDGLDDLVVGAGSSVNVYRNTGEGFVSVAAGSAQASELHVFDHDGDGGEDLVSRVGSRFELWTIDTEGVMTRGPTILHGIFRSTRGASSHPVFGDVDGDGDQDIAVFGSWGEYVIVRRVGPAAYKVEPRRQGGPATGLADIDNDGDPDGVCCAGGPLPPWYNDFPSTYHVCHNDGTGGFGPAQTIPGLGAARLAGATDVDGDGFLDLVAGRTILFNREGFARGVQPSLSLSTAANFLSIDPDGDGDPDLMGSWVIFSGRSWYYRNDGCGGFAFQPESLPPAPGFAAWRLPGYRGDFDGDGDEDLIVGRDEPTAPDRMQLLLNQGGGSFVDAGQATAPGMQFVAPPYVQATMGPRAVLLDADSDGDLDIVPSFTSPTWVWLNDGRGFFTRGQQLAVNDTVGAADLDGDGTEDLVLVSGTRLEVWFANGDGTFVQTISEPTGQPATFSWAPGSVAIGDLDTDGDVDIAWAQPLRAQILRNIGGREMQREPVASPELRFNSFHGLRAYIADVDADGQNDLMIYPVENAHKTTAILRGDGRGEFRAPLLQFFEAKALYDADGDGDADVIGDYLVRNARHGIAAGHRVQYGQSGVGLGGVTPTLGAIGPFRVGQPIRMRATGLPGGVPLVIAWGSVSVALAEFPLPGLQTWVYPWQGFGIVGASGVPGESGTGLFEFTYSVPASAAGVALFSQVFAFDPSAPSQFNYTNGLAVRYGVQ